MKIRHLFPAILAAGLIAPAAWGQQQSCDQEREVSPGTMTEQVYSRLSRIYEDIGEEKYSEAYSQLQSVAERRLSDYERAVIQQAMGFVRASQERWQEAVNHFNEAIRLNQMPNNQHFEMILQVAQLYNIMERYDSALEQLDLWFCLAGEEQAEDVPDIWVLKASLHVQKDEFREAVTAIDRAIDISDEPKESWFQLKLGAHFELEQWSNAVATLKILVGMNPDRKSYWVQMSSAYLQMEQEPEASAALRLAYRQNLLDSQTEFVQLASLLQAQGAPRQAAEILSDGLEQEIVESTRQHWDMLAGAWFEAQELDNALVAYERAGALSDDGALDLQRAFILTNQERWEEVLEATSRALQKGGLSETQSGNAYLLTGMAHFNQNQLDSAEEAFNRAANYGRLQSAAREWLNHIRRARQRQAS